MATYRTKSLFEADPDFRKNPKSDYFCINCHKTIDPSKPHRLVHMVEGGAIVLHPEDESLYESDGGDCGHHPIGNDCAKRLGNEWSIPA